MHLVGGRTPYFVNFMNSLLIIIVKLHKPFFLIIDEQICDFLELLESHPKANLSLCFFSPSQCKSRSRPKERLLNETSKFVIFGSSKKVIQKQTFATFFSASQCKPRSRPKERLWNETSKFVISGRSMKVIQKRTFATFFSASHCH